MIKKVTIASVLIFISWQLIDFIIHGMFLFDQYTQTSQLWRPVEEMKRGLLMSVSFISAICFSAIFILFFKEQDIVNGFKYGVIFGLATGFSMSLGTYSFQPITCQIAIGWFLAGLLQGSVGGVITGAVCQKMAK